jgi:hypothetical protein
VGLVRQKRCQIFNAMALEMAKKNHFEVGGV